jgi:hypothetical protein
MWWVLKLHSSVTPYSLVRGYQHLPPLSSVSQWAGLNNMTSLHRKGSMDQPGHMSRRWPTRILQGGDKLEPPPTTTLKMEAVCCSETIISNDQTAQCHNSEDCKQSEQHDNLYEEDRCSHGMTLDPHSEGSKFVYWSDPGTQSSAYISTFSLAPEMKHWECGKQCPPPNMVQGPCQVVGALC